MYGFAKNERENIENDELTTLREIAAVWLEADDEHLDNAIRKGFLQAETGMKIVCAPLSAASSMMLTAL